MNDRNPAEVWKGEFGESWTDRNPQSVPELNADSDSKYGQSKTDIVKNLLSDIERDVRVLDIGANNGAHLKLLQELGFKELYGLDVQEYAIRKAKRETGGIEFLRGDGMNLPFENESFDMIFTTGVLIHVPPQEIEQTVQEISRCASEYVWGIEYYAEEYTEIDYRGHDSLLWKADFAKEYCRNTDLSLEKQQLLAYQDGSNNHDVAFLLAK